MKKQRIMFCKNCYNDPQKRVQNKKPETTRPGKQKELRPLCENWMIDNQSSFFF